MTTHDGPSPGTRLLRWAEMDVARPLPGITAVAGIGSQLSAAVFTLDAGAVVPDHSHDNEEFGQVLSGSLELHWADQTVVLQAGEAFLLPAGVPHGARALDDGCALVECYAPPRNPIPTTTPGDAS